MSSEGKWVDKIPIKGTDAGTNKPLLEEGENIEIYIANIFKGDKTLYLGTEDYNGIEV